MDSTQALVEVEVGMDSTQALVEAVEVHKTLVWKLHKKFEKKKKTKDFIYPVYVIWLQIRKLGFRLGMSPFFFKS
ncbi:hypothetical protein [Candidatus Phytoplasma fabacearum]|uniref:hypothetical protein n=1 Tax=Candidatus Phytoplasma fabacearum TaxID=2982628 RepID=UPI0030ECCF94